MTEHEEAMSLVLPSSDGWSRLEIRVIGPSTVEGEEHIFVCNVEIKSQCWPRGEDLEDAQKRNPKGIESVEKSRQNAKKALRDMIGGSGDKEF